MLLGIQYQTLMSISFVSITMVTSSEFNMLPTKVTYDALPSKIRALTGIYLKMGLFHGLVNLLYVFIYLFIYLFFFFLLS